jgi:hypothetical protein
MERQGELVADEREKALILRTYERLSGRSITDQLQKSVRRKGFLHRVGWFIESLFYGRPKQQDPV